jgi:outer membrane protein TolC
MRLLFLLCLIPCVLHAQSGNEKREFQKFLEAVGDENPRVLSAQAEALSAKAAQLSNLLSWTPSVTAQVSQSIKSWGADAGETATVEAQLNLFRFGGDSSRIQEARLTRKQADLRISLASLETEARAAQILFQWIELERRLEGQRALYDSKKELLNVAQERFNRGQLPAQEVEKVRLDARNSEISIRQAEVDLLDLKAQLEAFLPGASRLRAWPWTSAAKSPPRLAVKKVSDRMNFARLQLETEIRSAKTWQATADWLPRVDLSSTWQTAEVSPIGKGEWTSFLTLTIPLWERGQALSSRGFWFEQRRAAEQDLELYSREESAKLQTLEERREKLRQNLLVALESNERAKTLASESLRRFQLGRTSVNDLLIDQARVYDSESLAQQALRQFHLILLETCLAADERPSRCF